MQEPHVAPLGSEMRLEVADRIRNTRCGAADRLSQHFFEARGCQFLHTTMDPYDSDSSLDEDFTETSVLLGYAAEEVIEDTISHLGGWPVCSLPNQLS